MICNHPTARVICAMLLLVVPGTSRAQTPVRFSIQSSYPEIVESYRCDERSPDRRFELLSWPVRGPLPIQDPTCIGRFFSGRTLRAVDEWNSWREGHPPKIFCRANPVLDKVPSPSGGKPMFCGTMCVHGEPVRFCTH
jgi:hypothetical protein